MNKETSTKGSPLILIMGDDESVARRLQMILNEEGYTVDWAPTGRSALDKCGQKPLDFSHGGSSVAQHQWYGSD